MSLVSWKLSLNRHSVHYRDSQAKDRFESFSSYQNDFFFFLVKSKVTHELNSTKQCHLGKKKTGNCAAVSLF